MKQYARSLLPGAFLAGLLIVNGASAQTGAWQDSFESYPSGAGVPSPWQGDGAGNLVSNAEQLSGEAALALLGGPGGCWASICDREIPLTNSLYIEFGIRPSGNHVVGCHPWAGLIGLRTTRSWTSAQGRWFLHFASSPGNPIVTGVPGQSEAQTISSWRYDEWRRIGILYYNHVTNVSLTYFLDGRSIGPVQVPTYEFESSLQYLVFDSGDGTTWIDDVLVGPPSLAPAPPSIVNAPTSQVVRSGSAVTFSVSATGSPAPTYQWRLNGVPIAGATGASYSIPLTTAASLGRYDVEVSNSQGSVTSAPASLAFLDIQMFAGLLIEGTVGDTFQIQSRPLFDGADWSHRTNVTLTSPRFIWIDPTSPSHPKLFYRALPNN